MEVWKEIEGTHGRYFISNKGQVKSLCGRTDRILKQKKHRVIREGSVADYARIIGTGALFWGALFAMAVQCYPM